MDVGNRIRRSLPILLAACLPLVTGARAVGDPVYSVIDLGTGTPTFGIAADGSGTVTGSNGQTYAFNPVQNALSPQETRTTQGVPTYEAPRPGNGDSGNPANDFSVSTLSFMNSQGLAAGINQYGVSGHLANSEAFVTQLQPNGTWGPPSPLWSGAENFAFQGPANIGIFGISANGQVFGYGVQNFYSQYPINTLYLYDTNTHQLTNITNLVDSLKLTNATDLPAYQNTNWNVDIVAPQIDNQGRILVQATEGYSGPDHNLLLIPAGLSSAPVRAPEPATWAVFATLIGGWLVRRRLHSATRPG